MLLTPNGSLAIGARLLEQIFDQTPDIAFFIKDTAGRYRVVNHSLVERSGLREKRELIGRRPGEIVPGELGRAHGEQDTRVLRSGRPLINHLELHWRAPHRPVWCLTTKLLLHDAGGNVSGLIGISRDLSQPVTATDIPAGLAKAIQLLEQNYASPLRTADLARRSGLSGPRFARLVKRVFSITPSQLITQRRVTAAAELLRDTDKSVAEIAVACGFYDHSAFTRAYRSATGQTPTEFRRWQQE